MTGCVLFPLNTFALIAIAVVTLLGTLGPILPTGDNHHILDWFIIFSNFDSSDILDEIHSRLDLSKHRMLPIQKRTIVECDEEL